VGLGDGALTGVVCSQQPHPDQCRATRHPLPQAAGEPLLPLGEGLLCLGCGAAWATPEQHPQTVSGGAKKQACSGVMQGCADAHWPPLNQLLLLCRLPPEGALCKAVGSPLSHPHTQCLPAPACRPGCDAGPAHRRAALLCML
jgi:hypothetical protein